MVSMLIFVLVAACGTRVNVTATRSPDLTAYWTIKSTDRTLIEQFHTGIPNYTIVIPDEKLWRKGSIDQKINKMLLRKGTISLKAKKVGIPIYKKGKYDYLLIDLRYKRVIWDIALPRKINFYGSGFTGTGDVFLSLEYDGDNTLFLDSNDGVEKWRCGKGSTQECPSPHRIFVRGDFIYTLGGEQVFIVNPNTYEIVHTGERFETEMEKFSHARGSGHSCPPFFNSEVYTYDDETILVDNGLHVVSNKTGKVEWSSRFPTYACRFHTGKNIALCGLTGCSFCLAASGGGGTVAHYRALRPDVVSQKTLIFRTDRYYVVSALSNVYCIDRSNGEIIWARNIGIAFADLLHVDNNLVYIAAYGNQANGLYCFSMRDGAPVQAFQSPFTEKIRAEKLTGNMLSELTEEVLWVENNDCYLKQIKGQPCVFPSNRLIKVVPTKDNLVALTRDSILLIDFNTGAVLKSFKMDELGTERIENIFNLEKGKTIGITKKEIVSLDTYNGKYEWIYKSDWNIDRFNKVQSAMIFDKYLLIYSYIGKKLNGYIIEPDTGQLVMKLEGDELWYDKNTIALRKERHIQIFANEPI